MSVDCDNDTLLIQANPVGPVCHNGTGTCWGTYNQPSSTAFLANLEAVIEERKRLHLIVPMLQVYLPKELIKW
jgi:phosphoribosyl-ATP pyrophosphohydrolase/phosphoribosyl-AMP cyclohydrolase